MVSRWGKRFSSLGPSAVLSGQNHYGDSRRAAGEFGRLAHALGGQHLRKHIPGNPNIVMQYMAGGGRQAANHVYKVAKPDGLTVGSMGAALVANAVLGEPGV